MLITRKKLLVGFLFFLALCFLGSFIVYEYSLLWIEKEIAATTKRLQQKGYSLSYASFSVAGNPLLLNVSFKEPSLKDAKGTWKWQGEEAVISVYPWKPYQLSCSFPGDQKISLPQNLPFTFETLSLEDMEGILLFSAEGHLKNLDLKIGKVSSFVGDKVQPVTLKALSLKATDLVTPLSLKFTFSTEVSNLETLLKESPLDYNLILALEGELSGYAAKMPPTSLSQWRDGGGVLELASVKVSWPPIHGEAEGTLTLHKNMYLLGSFSSRIQGYQEALADMVSLGWINKKKAATASFILDLFSSPNSSGGKTLTVPITLQNGVLSIGPAPLLKLQPLEDL